MEINIALCDDEKHQRDYLVYLINKWNPQIRIAQFESAEQYKMLREEDDPHDILLLDIQMGGQDGVTLAKELREAKEDMAIIFITGITDLIHEGYDVNALHYLIKPVDETKLFAVLDKAVTQLNKTEKYLLLPVDGEIVKIISNEILYVESFAHYLDVVTTSGNFSVKMPAYKIEQQLGKDFIRCHRSYLVSLRHINKITKTDIVLDNGKIIPLSRRMYKEVNEAFMEYVTRF